MGRNMTDKQYEYLKRLLGWLDRDKWDFRTFCGMCALCERLLASEYCPHVSDRKSDPCHEVIRVESFRTIIILFSRLKQSTSNRSTEDLLVKPLMRDCLNF